MTLRIDHRPERRARFTLQRSMDLLALAGMALLAGGFTYVAYMIASGG